MSLINQRDFFFFSLVVVYFDSEKRNFAEAVIDLLALDGSCPRTWCGYYVDGIQTQWTGRN
jgi:hypothetical protein